MQLRLGAAVKAGRQRLGVTQEELAWRADMHRTYLADIERGTRNVTLKCIANLARALEVSVPGLLLASNTAEISVNSRPGDILLVEDEALDAELVVRAFRRLRIANPLKVVRDGREALEYLGGVGRYARPRPASPELVLLDLGLPDMSGVEVLREIKRHASTSLIPVIMLTGSRHDRTIIECARLGAVNYIIKPLGFANFSKVAPGLDLSWALMRPRGGVQAPSGR